MATVASRLQHLTGLSGLTMAQYLQALAAGSTVAAVLVAHSGLVNATMADHLMVEAQTTTLRGGIDGGFAPWHTRYKFRREDLEDELEGAVARLSPEILFPENRVKAAVKALAESQGEKVAKVAREQGEAEAQQAIGIASKVADREKEEARQRAEIAEAEEVSILLLMLDEL